jgi:hypothetical protein
VRATRPRDLLTDAVLGRLRGTDGADAATLARDIACLRDAGYLNAALPPGLGGLSCTLRQAACGQRGLAAAAPRTALAVSAHLYWTGTAADAVRSGDESVRWILAEAARGALFGGGHGEPGGDLRFAAPASACDPDGRGGYRLRDPAAALASVTPRWDWLAVHGLAEGPPRQAVLAFAGQRRGTRRSRGYRVARVLPPGAPCDVFTASAVGWGCSLLASVEFSAARQEFRRALAVAEAAAISRADGPSCPPGRARPEGGDAGHALGQPAGGHPLDRWPVAEAALRVEVLKARIAEVTHPWPAVPEPGPDLGGQRLISLYAMRHEVAEGAAIVRALSAGIISQCGGNGVPAPRSAARPA